ncbi:hypothetical protein ABL78_7759 [Leptomonas seymouri]|uniref:Uncharacterized protein n=1 Tax=Leptomonas seymouri TaxID=5684 RepID=A0A0N1PAA9_LEPSE|nr:hypothetical protein ABL78_7759 [Leptomonas seymouri]|eukprot:KPI83220.1 hypothetical protein ABL78_7759 [Leptomonas seymouri]
MADMHLASLLKGVEAERGAMVTCRDPSALEMLLRVGSSDANQGSISVMFQRKSSSNGSTGAAGGQMLFVKERYARTLEGEVQSWLDPFKTATSATSPTTASKTHKRTRGDSDSDSDESSFESNSSSD